MNVVGPRGCTVSPVVSLLCLISFACPFFLGFAAAFGGQEKIITFFNIGSPMDTMEITAGLGVIGLVIALVGWISGRFRLQRGIATVVLSLSALTLFEHFYSVRLGIDLPASRRMGINMAIALGSLSLFLVYAGPCATKATYRLGNFTAGLAWTIATAGFFGYCVLAPPWIGWAHLTAMAPIAAVAIFLLSSIILVRLSYQYRRLGTRVLIRPLIVTALASFIFCGWQYSVHCRKHFLLNENTLGLSSWDKISELNRVWYGMFGIYSLTLFAWLFYEMRGNAKRRNLKSSPGFAALLVHDLREPLRTTKLQLQLAQTQLSAGSMRDTRERLSCAFQSTDRMQRLCEQLIDYGTSGFRNRRSQQFSLQRVVDEVRENIAALLLQSNAQIVAENLPVVTGDAVGISLIIQNLITNAIRYRSERRPVIVVEATEKDEGWIISVTDNGIGIDAKNMGRLFKPFSRLAGTGEVTGAGLGLYICSEIVRAHDGEIWVISEVGEGTSFYFSLFQHGTLKHSG